MILMPLEKTGDNVTYEFSRTELLIGREGLEKLKNTKVAVFGIGGVGSFVVEALARAGVGRLVLIDNDVIVHSNINRQIHATHKTLGRPKVEVMKERVLDINPDAEVTTYQMFYSPGNNEELAWDYDYVVDAIDTVTSKIDLIVRCKTLGINIISSMGAGNKLDPTAFEVADIYSTKVCPLAKVIRKELRKRGITSLKVVYSTEDPIKPAQKDCTDPEPLSENLDGATQNITKKRVPGSISFVPSVAGLIIAGEIVRDCIGITT